MGEIGNCYIIFGSIYIIHGYAIRHKLILVFINL